MNRLLSSIFGLTLRRLVLLMMVVQLVPVGLALGLMYSFTQQTIIADARNFVGVAQSDLEAEFRDNGLPTLTREIEARMAMVEERDFIVLLRGPNGQRISGNLTAWPATVSDHERWRKIQLYRQGAATPEEMGIMSTRLPGGYAMITGQVLEGENRLSRASERALLWSLLLGLVTTALTMLLVEYLLDRRINDFTVTAAAVQRGELNRRVDRNLTGDAFDRLASSINAMLARIESLIAELRMVTDSMAHDLRSPVSRMKAVLERAIAETHEQTAQTALGEAICEADRLHRMLNTALQISRAEAGMGRDQFTTFSLADLFVDAAEVYGPLAEDSGFAITINCPDPIIVRAHRHLLMQVITNLIDNALAYAKGGTTIILKGRLATGLVEIVVEDNGPGIPPDRREEAMRRFVRLDASRGETGAGLGLSLGQTIAHLHQGHMWLEESVGGGLAVFLLLAIAD